MVKTVYLSYAIIPTKKGCELWVSDSNGNRTWSLWSSKRKALAFGEALIAP